MLFEQIFSGYKLFTMFLIVAISNCAITSLDHFIFNVLLHKLKLSHFLMVFSYFLLAINQNFFPQKVLRLKLSKIFSAHHK